MAKSIRVMSDDDAPDLEDSFLNQARWEAQEIRAATGRHVDVEAIADRLRQQYEERLELVAKAQEVRQQLWELEQKEIQWEHTHGDRAMKIKEQIATMKEEGINLEDENVQIAAHCILEDKIDKYMELRRGDQALAMYHGIIIATKCMVIGLVIAFGNLFLPSEYRPYFMIPLALFLIFYIHRAHRKVFAPLYDSIDRNK